MAGLGLAICMPAISVGAGPGEEPAVGLGLPVERGVTGSAVWRWLGVGGHFEEVEDAADISVQSSQGLGDMKPTRLDELDGEASQAGGVFGAVSGADTAAVLIEGSVETTVGGIFDAPVASVQ